MRKKEREAEIEERKRALQIMNGEDHIHEAEQLIERAERQPMTPAQAAMYAAATAHAALATAKMTAGGA